MRAAAELYAGAPAAFVADRKQRAADARKAGDRDLAARIAALPKPSAAAGLANRLLRDAPDDLARVLRLGADLQAAQEEGDRQRLRELAADRRHLLEEVAEAAADREERDGKRPGASALEELQQTLQAAMTSPEAAAAVRSGRLVRALAADGLEPADLSGAVAPEGTLPAAEPIAPSARSSREPAPAPDPEEQRRAEAQQRAEEARARAAEAQSAADDAAAEADDAEARAAERADAVEQLRGRLEELRRRLDDEESALDRARDEAARARTAADEAAGAAETASAEAERLDAEV